MDAPRQHTLSKAHDVLGDLFKGIDEAMAGGKQYMDELPDAEKGSTKAAKRRNAIAKLTAVRDALAVEESDIEDACHHGPHPPPEPAGQGCACCVSSDRVIRC